MNCKHTETTAVLAAFGEAPTDFEQHLAECAACRNVVRQHTETLAALLPVTEGVRSAPKRWHAPAIGFLSAAAILLATQFTSVTSPTLGPSIESIDPTHQRDHELFSDTLDSDLAMLEIELALYYLEES